MRATLFTLGFAAVLVTGAGAQQATRTQPVQGMRDNGVWDLDGLTVYPGFIDAHADLDMDAVPEGGDIGPTHWNPQVRAWFSTTRNLADDEDRRAALRSQGFGTALVVPKEGIFRGTASVVNLGNEGVHRRSASSARSTWADRTRTPRWARSRS